MKTHFLKKLNIVGSDKVLKIEPEFDFYMMKSVKELRLDFAGSKSEKDTPVLEMTCEYRTAGMDYNVTLRLKGIRDLQLPLMSGNLFLNELEIEDVKDDGLENIAFYLIAQYEKGFKCACKELEIVSFDPA